MILFKKMEVYYGCCVFSVRNYCSGCFCWLWSNGIRLGRVNLWYFGHYFWFYRKER